MSEQFQLFFHSDFFQPSAAKWFFSCCAMDENGREGKMNELGNCRREEFGLFSILKIGDSSSSNCAA